MSAPFQVMPALTPSEFDELRDDIAANGITVPVVVDQHGRVLDGHHRLQIAGLLGIDPADVPRVVREVADAQEARSLAYSLNLHRRHLDREARRALLAESIKADPGLSDRQHAERAGVSPTTAGKARAELEAAGDVSNLDTRTDSAGRQQPAYRRLAVDTTTGEITETAGAGEAPTRAGFTEDTSPAPATITGHDGKTYIRPAPSVSTTPKRRPLTDAFLDATYDLTKAVDRLARLVEDDRFPQNAEKAAQRNRGDLLRARDSLAGVIAVLNSSTGD